MQGFIHSSYSHGDISGVPGFEIEQTSKQIINMVQGYGPSAVIFAAADLELFGLIGTNALTANEVAQQLSVKDTRGITILCDALAALELLNKDLPSNKYSVPRAVLICLGAPRRPGSLLALVQHMSNVYRGWGRLAEIIKSDGALPGIWPESIRGKAADFEAFIEAMNDMHRVDAEKLIRDLKSLKCTHVLDVGGATGTWAIAFMNVFPQAKATIFDLPQVTEMAKKRLAEEGMESRIAFVSGDFSKQELPQNTGADVAWLSAITHMHSRQQNRELFAKVFRALSPKGVIAIRDYVMEEGHAAPVGGALFAVNMLVHTPKGDCFTFKEFREDLESVGFHNAELVRQDHTMSAVVTATKP